MKFLTAYRKLLDGEFKAIRRFTWTSKLDYLVRATWFSSILNWYGTTEDYLINEEDAFADDWEGIK